ncbi:MAG TPA: hypothetical protein VGE32_05430 [Cellvibrio sp.]
MQFHLKALVFKQFPLVIASLFLAACTSTAVPKPDVNYADNYSVASPQSDMQTIAVDSHWWHSYQSAALNE